MTDLELAARIDHTLLKPDAVLAEVMAACVEAVHYGFAGVCVAGSWIPLVVRALGEQGPKVIGVAGFPLGNASTEAKAYEAALLIGAGADEIDIVINLGHAQAGLWGDLRDDLQAIVDAAAGRPVKAILETGLLTAEQTVRAAEAAVLAGAAFVKTSTGFGYGGATVEAVRLLRATVGSRAQVKASGGIRTRAQALALIEAGADRLGASASVQVVGGP